MEKILNIEKTVFEQIKENEMPINKICTFAHVPVRSIHGWSRKEPQSIEYLKKINHVMQLISKLSKLGVSVELKNNAISLSCGGWQEFTNEPIGVQIRDICKAEMAKDQCDEYLLLMVKVFKACR